MKRFLIKMARKRVILSLNEHEYATLSERLTKSTHRYLAKFVKENALREPVVERIHNASVERAYEALVEIKTDLQLACDSFERSSDQIKEYVGGEKIETELIDLELKRRKLILQLQKAFDRISKLADQ